MTKIIVGFPPNYDEISAAFPLSGKEIFAWDGTIYSPVKDLPIWLIKHEEVHFEQQKGDPEDWWSWYIADSNFRLQQEIPAHKVEYQVYCRHNKDRNQQLKTKIELARRLSSDMYGSMVTMKEAMEYFK